MVGRDTQTLTAMSEFVTARKRSLGQGNVFTPVCHSVHRGVSIPACTTGRMTGGSLSRGSLSRGVSVQGGLCPGGSLSRGVSVQGGSLSRGISVQGSLSPMGVSIKGALCPGGVSVQGGLCPGGSLSRGVSVLGGFCPGGSLSRGVSVQGGSLSRGLSVQGESLSRGGGLCQGDPRTVKSGWYPLSWNAFLFEILCSNAALIHKHCSYCLCPNEPPSETFKTQYFHN